MNSRRLLLPRPLALPIAFCATLAGGGLNAATGSLEGIVTHAGASPPAVIQMDADPTCKAFHDKPVYAENLVTDEEGHLANVFIYVKDGLAPTGYETPPEPHLLNQDGCQYRPHVSGMQVGQMLIIRNDDDTLHNVHALPQANREFNFGQPFSGMEVKRKFDKPEVMIRFKCDVHPWMSAFVGVLEHPFFAVSDAAGRFTIPDLPAGTYTLEAWHEELGTRTREVTVRPGETARVEFDF